MYIYDGILDGYQAAESTAGESREDQHEAAIDWSNGMVWSECEGQEQSEPAYSDLIETANGVEIYYCYGADHYWFAPVEQPASLDSIVDNFINGNKKDALKQAREYNEAKDFVTDMDEHLQWGYDHPDCAKWELVRLNMFRSMLELAL